MLSKRQSPTSRCGAMTTRARHLKAMSLLITVALCGCGKIESFTVDQKADSTEIRLNCASGYLELSLDSMPDGFDGEAMRPRFETSFVAMKVSTGKEVDRRKGPPIALLQGHAKGERFQFLLLHKINLPYSLRCHDYLIRLELTEELKLVQASGEAQPYVGPWRHR